MPGGTFGGFSPFPRQFAGGPRRIEFIYSALQASRGGAYDTSDWSSTVSIENRAFARCIEGRYWTNDRAANQFDPTRASDMLPRWERIYSIYPLPTDNPVQRRARLAFHWGQNTQAPDYQQIVNNLTTLMGAVFVEIVHTTSAQSGMIYQGGPNPNPYDIESTTTTGVSWVDWSSAVSHIAIKIQQPASIPYPYYQELLSAGLQYLDGALPSWVTFSTFSSVGFVLDQANFGVACLSS